MDVLEYEDYRRFLSDWFDASGRTHRWVMRQLGSRDPSVLRRVIVGERPLSPNLVDPLVDLMELDDVGARAFRLLITIAHPRSAEEQAQDQLALRGLRAVQAARRLRDPSLYLHWCRPAVAELTRAEGFRDDLAWIASMMEPAAPLEAVAAALDAVRGRPASVTTGEEVSSPEVFGYYRGVHQCADEALDRLEADPSYVDQTLFLGLTLGVPESLVPELRKRLLEVQYQLLGLADASCGVERVVQVNLQLFPLTRRVVPGTP